uniref:Uncharacterized protein n=1 Tax=Oryzias latipes TaxID=8090 RepID=A0A3B3I5X4_ORYLA
EEETEINTILFKMEDVIQERRKTGDKGLFHLPGVLSRLLLVLTSTSSAHLNPPSVVEATKKKSNKMQHLYRKLCDIDKELSLLDPSSFQKPNSYSQALQQVQSMKGLIEVQLFPPSHAKEDEPTHNK